MRDLMAMGDAAARRARSFVSRGELVGFTLAAFAAVLYKIVTGDSIVSALTSLIQSALSPQW